MFRVRQIELVGVRNLAPDAVIAALRLGPRASVFGDTRLLADRVRGLAGGAGGRGGRRGAGRFPGGGGGGGGPAGAGGPPRAGGGGRGGGGEGGPPPPPPPPTR